MSDADHQRCDNEYYVRIIDDYAANSSNVSLCYARGRREPPPAYRSRGHQVRVHVNTRRPFLITYRGTTDLLTAAAAAAAARELIYTRVHRLTTLIIRHPFSLSFDSY